MSSHPIYFGKSSMLRSVSEDLGEEVDMEGVCVGGWVEEARDVHCSGLWNLGLLFPLGFDFHVCFSPTMIAAFSQTSLLQAGKKQKNKQKNQSPVVIPQSTICPKLLCLRLC